MELINELKPSYDYEPYGNDGIEPWDEDDYTEDFYTYESLYPTPDDSL